MVIIDRICLREAPNWIFSLDLQALQTVLKFAKPFFFFFSSLYKWFVETAETTRSLYLNSRTWVWYRFTPVQYIVWRQYFHKRLPSLYYIVTSCLMETLNISILASGSSNVGRAFVLFSVRQCLPNCWSRLRKIQQGAAKWFLNLKKHELVVSSLGVDDKKEQVASQHRAATERRGAQ